MYRIAVFISGSGSNFQAIANYFKNISDIEVTLCISSRKNAFGVQRSKNMDIDYECFELKDFKSREEQEKEISKILKARKIDLVVLAGYMLLMKFDMLKWNGRMVNIHPSLLPKFPGVKSIEDTFYSNEKNGGITIHYVDSRMDTGKIIVQASIEINRTKGIKNYEKEIHKLEWEHYPKTIEKILRSK